MKHLIVSIYDSGYGFNVTIIDNKKLVNIIHAINLISRLHYKMYMIITTINISKLIYEKLIKTNKTLFAL